MKVLICLTALIALASAGTSNWWECQGCQAIGNALESLLKTQSFEDQVTSIIEGFCDKIPDATLAKDCMTGIQQDSQAIYAKIQDLLEPDAFCPAIGFCPASVKFQRAVRGLECEACEYCVNEVKSLIVSSNILPTILNYVQDVCTVLPTDLQASCNQIVTQYGQQIVTDILAILDPQTACSDIHLCSAKSAVSNLAVKSETCSMCKTFMQFIDGEVSQAEPALIALLNGVCDMLPNSMKDDCLAFVKNEGADIMAYVMGELEPTKACTEMGACSSTFVLPVSSQKDMCATCKAVDNQLVQYLQENKDKVMAVVDSACQKLGALASMCESYADQAFSFVITQLNPDVLCKELKLC